MGEKEPEAEDKAEAALSEPFRSGDAESNLVTLTINVDWGNEYIPSILASLEEAGIKATFFLTGRWTEEYPDLAKTIADAGHEIGNHGYSHSSPNASSIEEIQDEISRTEEAIAKATGITTTLYAPPSGECEEHVLEAAEQAGYDTVLWTADTIDWQQPDSETIIRRVTEKISGGGVILAHPTESTAEALPEMIRQVEEMGYTFVTISENMAGAAHE